MSTLRHGTQMRRPVPGSVALAVAAIGLLSKDSPLPLRYFAIFIYQIPLPTERTRWQG